MSHINQIHITRTRILKIILQYLSASFRSSTGIPLSFPLCCSAIRLAEVLTYNPYDRWETFGRRLVWHGLGDLLDSWGQSDICWHCWTPCALVVHPQRLQHHGPEVLVHVTRVPFTVHL